MKKKIILILAACSILPLALTSCGGASSTNSSLASTSSETTVSLPSSATTPSTPVTSISSVDEVIHVESVKINNQEVSLKVGETLTLNVEVLPENADDKTLSYSSSDNDIAEVSDKGIVTAKKIGEVTISVKSVDGGKSDEIKLTIENPEQEKSDYYFEGEDAVLTSGSMGNISFNNSDANARNGTSLGNVNLNNGATITYSVKSKTASKASMYVSLAFGSKTNDNIFTLKVNDKDIDITSHFEASKDANWANYEEYFLADIDLIAGTNTITLTVTGTTGNYDYMKLVTDAEIEMQNTVSELNISTSCEMLKVGETATLSKTVIPSSLSSTEVVYTSDSSIVQIEGNVVTAKEEGVALITGTVQDEGKVTSQIKIFVSNATPTKYEAEEALLTNCNIESAAPDFVGGFQNPGAKVTFNINSSSERTTFMRVYTAVVLAGNTDINSYYDIFVNSSELDLSNGTFSTTGNPGWNTHTGFYTIEVDLKEGNNEIVLAAASVDTKTNLDGIALY